MTKILRTFARSLKTVKWWEWLILAAILVSLVALGCVFNASALIMVNMCLSIFGIACLTKGLAVGNFILIFQCVTYSWLSANNKYFGELILCVCVSAPLYVYALVNWLRKSEKNVVKIREKMGRKQWLTGLALVAVVTALSCLLMWAFGTDNLALSALSVFTSTFAAYLSARRSELNFIFYLLNNIVLVFLWLTKILQGGDLALWVTVVQCVFVTILNAFGLFNWMKLKKKQNRSDSFDKILSIVKAEI